MASARQRERIYKMIAEHYQGACGESWMNISQRWLNRLQRARMIWLQRRSAPAGLKA